MNSGGEMPDREQVSGPCPSCKTESLRRYPVLTSAGWFLSVKCTQCLHTIDRRPWRRLGWVSLGEDEEGAI
jgi:hypothetical protein